LADSPVELVPGQSALHERGLERADYPLAVRVRRPQMAAADWNCCHFVFRPCHHGTSRGGGSQDSVTRTRSVSECLLLLGEVHGVRENPLLIRALMQTLALTSLALEWPEVLPAART